MNASSRSLPKSEKSDQSERIAPQPPRANRRMSLLVVAVLFPLVAVVGVLAAIGIANWSFSGKPPELPSIPSVNLEGADPAIAKLVREADRIREASPHSAIAWGEYAMVLHVHGFREAADASYVGTALLDPKNPTWPYLRGYLSLHGPGGPAAALPHFQLAANLGPPDSPARLRLADTLLELGRLDEAEQEYRKILAIHHDDPQAQLGLGRLAVARGQHRESLTHLLIASEYPGTQNRACALLASVHQRLGDWEAADRARERLAKTPPDQPRADDPVLDVAQFDVGVHAELAKANNLMQQNRVDEMLAVVEAAVHRNPDCFEAWDALSNARAVAGDSAGAKRAAQKGTQLAPKNADAWLSLGNVLIWERRYQDAIEPLEKSIALKPRFGEAYLALGDCRKALRDSAGAAEAYREALRYMPDHPKARQQLEELLGSP